MGQYVAGPVSRQWPEIQTRLQSPAIGNGTENGRVTGKGRNPLGELVGD